MISLSDMIPFSTNGSKSSSPKSFHKEPFPPKLAYGEEGKEAEVYIGLHSPQQSIGKVNDTAQTFIPSNRQDMESQTQSFTEFDRTRFAVKMSQTVSPATAESSYQQLHSKQSVDKASQTVVQHDEPVETVLLCKESVPPVPTAIYSRHACLPKDCVPRFAPLVRDYSKKRRGRLPDIQYPVCSPTVFSPPNLCDCACIDYEYAIGRAGCRRPVRRCACYPTDDMAWDQCFSKVSNVRCRPEEENEGQMFGGYRYVKIVEEICHPEGSRSIDPSPYLYRTPSDFTDFNECDCCLEI